MPAGASASDGSSSGTRHPPSGFPTLGPQAPSAIALLIAGISILGAIAAARAAWAAQEATLVERRHVQALMLRELRLLEIQGQVDHDYRLAGLYASFALGADHLQREAEALRATQPDRAAWFDLRAQEERARRRAIVPFFRVALPSTTNGIPAYDRDEIVRRRVATNRELREISADIRDSGTQLERAHATTWLLEACVAILVFSLLFLTLAMAEVGGQQWRGVLVGLGVGLAFVGLGAGLLVEVGWAVDLFVRTAAH